MIEHVRSLSNFGFDAKRSVIMTHGTNAKLDELRAAVGLAVLDEIDGRIERRRASALHIIGALGHDFVPQVGHERGTYQFVSVLTPTPMRRERILRASKTVVQLRTYYEPLHRFPAFSGVSSYGDLAVTEDVAARILSLPMYDNMTEEEGLLVCDVVGKP
jgi:dTDP-4-amino-4,6-dideoxygalactose transaminase